MRLGMPFAISLFIYLYSLILFLSFWLGRWRFTYGLCCTCQELSHRSAFHSDKWR